MRVKSGNAEVDAIVGGGFPSTAIHVIMGAPGTGTPLRITADAMEVG